MDLAMKILGAAAIFFAILTFMAWLSALYLAIAGG
jgi:hypothetical protein